MYLVSEVFPEDGYNLKEILLTCLNGYYNKYKCENNNFAQLNKNGNNIKLDLSRENTLPIEKGEGLCTIIT